MTDDLMCCEPASDWRGFCNRIRRGNATFHATFASLSHSWTRHPHATTQRREGTRRLLEGQGRGRCICRGVRPSARLRLTGDRGEAYYRMRYPQAENRGVLSYRA